ncbi:MAG: HAMP domain-containing sensor histidine kinase [Sulfurimonas sp.]|nr:HAMP domain-containing sensor histidine kinase [Sulfurimonas sp.]
MLVERESLRRFLLVYISSTIFLLGVGSYFYYKMSYQAMVERELSVLRENVDSFMSANHQKRFIKTGVQPDYLGLKIAVYINQKYYRGNFIFKDIDFSKEHFFKDKRVYLVHKERKRWGEIAFLSYKELGEEIATLQYQIILFLLFATFFIIAIAFILGKIFLKPMRKSIDSLEEFIADATHEINTPLSSILINIELFKELYPDFKRVEEVEKIESSAFRISKVFQDLSFVKLNHTQKKEIQNIRVDLVLQERIEFFETLLKNKKLQLQTKITPKELEIDREDLIRLIDNLLSNAIKYTKVGGNIFVGLEESLTVSNDGEIRESHKIMAKFFRENRDEGGFGLGLYIVEKICDSYKFRFVITSKDARVHSKIYF